MRHVICMKIFLFFYLRQFLLWWFIDILNVDLPRNSFFLCSFHKWGRGGGALGSPPPLVFYIIFCTVHKLNMHRLIIYMYRPNLDRHSQKLFTKTITNNPLINSNTAWEPIRVLKPFDAQMTWFVCNNPVWLCLTRE